MCAKSLQSCPTLCDPIDHSPPDSSVHGILQARTLDELPRPPPGDLPDPGTKPRSPVFSALQVDSLPAEPLGKLKSGLTLSNSEVMKKLG